MRIDNVEQRQIADQTRNEENQRRNEERFDTWLAACEISGGETSGVKGDGASR